MLDFEASEVVARRCETRPVGLVLGYILFQMRGSPCGE